MPSHIYNRFRDRRRAREAGISLEELYKKQTEKIIAENIKTRSETQSQRVENMQKLADLVPGATIHDYNELERLPLLSVRFLIRTLWG